MTSKKSYSELIKIPDYHSRVKYLQVLDMEYEVPRPIIENFYKSNIWRKIRGEFLIRDRFCDLGIPSCKIEGEVPLVHHINPITVEQLVSWDPCLIDPDNLITTTIDTHNTIHYRKKKKEDYIERTEGDTKLW